MGLAVESKAAQIELSGSKSCDGWKWMAISLYDFGNTLAYYKWKEIQAVVGNVDQGLVMLPTVGLLGLLLKYFGLRLKQLDGENSKVPGDLV